LSKERRRKEEKKNKLFLKIGVIVGKEPKKKE
jgi:hypothetical protein